MSSGSLSATRSFCGEISPSKQLGVYLDRVRASVDVPVSTAEPWHVWFKNPELAEHVDFIGTHMLPYWEGISLERAVDYVIDHVTLLENTFPDKPVVIAEVGWPSNGRTRRSAVASPSNEATFLRRFLKRAEELEYIYYVMEAFDQPWKRETEGSVGAYWGVYDVERTAKVSVHLSHCRGSGMAYSGRHFGDNRHYHLCPAAH